MPREGTIVFGVTIPDYVTNADLYAAINHASDVLEEEAHVTAHDMRVDGIEGFFEEEPVEQQALRDEAHGDDGPLHTL